MGKKLCFRCNARSALLRRPKNGQPYCRECFYDAFETEIHTTIVESKLFVPGDRVAIGASGGKDSTVLAYVLKRLNDMYNYGIELFLLSVDEGITGYRDDSLETVKRNEQAYGIPLKIVSYQELYGWTMDAIVKEVGLKNNCTFCGVFRRQALDRGAALLGANKIVTGHNADDMAETVFMNILRGDAPRLQRCTNVVTGSSDTLPRCKPFKFTYEKEIVLYAYFQKLDYFSTECVYSPQAFRGHARAFLKDLEALRPSSIVDVIRAGEAIEVVEEVLQSTPNRCVRCGYLSSQSLCKACVLLEGLNRGLPQLGIGREAMKVQSELLASVAEPASAHPIASENTNDGDASASASVKAPKASRSARRAANRHQPHSEETLRKLARGREVTHVPEVDLQDALSW
ncbi:ATP-binding domain-containing protein 3 [Capsaspora owczarzaki ATCC 30864]|uniref:Cytoplasmic tRNA 2-thiolation protein 1 n=1 Tax=Capsaspora owczarzaki (strain ATCC 30864) TaxID=595528 RepID=A0A0D2WPB7_CAPO3|nr:ATP-binding domain-containing protein 3 [Capsaspora owczarzaki ATCC 30864]KJE93160.1 ATP-binding domain-containing protein 3 [Capsaspora owczarzaki ATCC 30864]|eukprot:XP_004347814.1 ATP-binding domain-containing protein 3 [Capsaspora owczarzaki ATCC 30864]